MADLLTPTIFSADQFGKPESFGAPKNRKYSEFQTFDTSPYAKRLADALSASTGSQQAKALATASKLGTGRSSSTAGMLDQIAADTENRIADTQLKAAQYGWEDLIKQKLATEADDTNKYSAYIGKYKTDTEAKSAQDQRNQEAMRDLVKSLAMMVAA